MAKKILYITLERENGNLFIFIKVPEEIESFFKELSKGKTKQSEVWLTPDNKGAEFYLLTPQYEEMEKKINSMFFNDYGSGLINGDRINLAPLRTVGASMGVKLKSDRFSQMPNLDLEFYIRELGRGVKNLWESSISKEKIKGVLTFEI